MIKPLPSLVPVSKLVQLSARHPVGNQGSRYHISYPIPAPGQKGVYLYFIHFELMAGGENPILVPTYLSAWDAEAGSFEELRRIAATEVGLTDASVTGRLNPADRQNPEFRGRCEELFRCYDALLAPFAAALPVLPLQSQKAAQNFRTLFPSLMERELTPCYQTLGGRFFGWLDRIKK